MKLNIIMKSLCLFYILGFCECKNDEENHKGMTIDEYVIGKDTCNLTDENGKRQGKWVPNYNNELKDTVYYEDGVISK